MNTDTTKRYLKVILYLATLTFSTCKAATIQDHQNEIQKSKAQLKSITDRIEQRRNDLKEEEKSYRESMKRNKSWADKEKTLYGSSEKRISLLKNRIQELEQKVSQGKANLADAKLLEDYKKEMQSHEIIANYEDRIKLLRQELYHDGTGLERTERRHARILMHIRELEELAGDEQQRINNTPRDIYKFMDQMKTVTGIEVKLKDERIRQLSSEIAELEAVSNYLKGHISTLEKELQKALTQSSQPPARSTGGRATFVEVKALFIPIGWEITLDNDAVQRLGKDTDTISELTAMLPNIGTKIAIAINLFKKQIFIVNSIGGNRGVKIRFYIVWPTMLIVTPL